MAISERMLSIKGNPYSYFTDFDQWYLWDRITAHSYGLRDSLCRLALKARTAPELSDERNSEEIDRAIDEIVRTDPLKIYEVVTIE